MRALRALEEGGLPREALDGLVRLAAQVIGARMAGVVFVDDDRERWVSTFGGSINDGPRSTSLAAHVIARDEPLVLPDVLSDPRFADGPLTKGALGVRFFAGHALVSPGGQRVGALCVMDPEPRALDESAAAFLAQVASLIDAVLVLQDRARRDGEEHLRAIFEHAPLGITLTDSRGPVLVDVNPAFAEMVGYSREELRGSTFDAVARRLMSWRMSVRRSGRG